MLLYDWVSRAWCFPLKKRALTTSAQEPNWASPSEHSSAIGSKPLSSLSPSSWEWTRARWKLRTFPSLLLPAAEEAIEVRRPPQALRRSS